MASSRSSALKLVEKKAASLNKPSVYWPNVEQKNLRWEIESRIKDPDRIWQSGSNLCGMATFFNTLAWDDPYLYAFYVCELYRCGAAYLGYGKKAPLLKPSQATRGSKLPPGMPTADWLALASLRDHLNGTLDYSYSMGVPVLKEIPLLGFLGNPSFVEAVGGITYPEDICNALKAVGYAKVVNRADWRYAAGAMAIDNANAYHKNNYRVLLLINTGIFSDKAGTTSMTADHWVKLAHRIETKGTGVRAWVYDPQDAGHHWLPKSGAFVHRNVFRGHFYGFIAARH